MDRRELPIAVFDSGLGGLSVLRALRKLLPQERFVYFGDSANAPYGSRPTAARPSSSPATPQPAPPSARCAPGFPTDPSSASSLHLSPRSTGTPDSRCSCSPPK